MQLLRPFSGGALLALVTAPALAMIPMHLASSPMPVGTGQELTLCAANVGRNNARVTLTFVNVRTGAIVSEKSLLLPVPGVQATSGDPCLSTTAEAIAAAGTQPGAAPPSSGQLLVVGTVTVQKGNPFFARAPLVTASIQVRNRGSEQAVETIPLTPANFVNPDGHKVSFAPAP